MYDNVWTQFSLKDFSISSVFNFVTDLDENPSSEECCGPEGVAKYEGKNEAKEESLMKAYMEFAGQDLDRLEPKPKINEQERGGSSSEEDYLPGTKDWREYCYNSFSVDWGKEGANKRTLHASDMKDYK